MAQKTSDRISATFSRLGKTLKSLCKVVVSSRKTSLHPLVPAPVAPIYILGNGPSLRKVLENDSDRLASSDCMAVNFFANSPEFKAIKPKYYILIDPHFFNSEADEAVRRLWQNLAEADWDMTLILPSGQRPMQSCQHIKVMTVNAIGLEGFDWFTNFAYNRRLGMPRPRNVLIPAIMAAIWLGYRTLYILGADHSWTETLRVDDDNTLISVQPHFYAEPDSEKGRVSAVYKDIKIHTILESFAVAFRAYHDIQRWAASHDVEIFNATPGSYIDAFPRKTL